MNDIQFAILRHAAGDGPAVPHDEPNRDTLIDELGRAGLLRVQSAPQAFGDDFVSVLEHSITFEGRCAYEAERDRRKAAGLPHRAAVAAWEILRTAGALFLGMVIGHSEGCVFGEKAEAERKTDKQAEQQTEEKVARVNGTESYVADTVGDGLQDGPLEFDLPDHGNLSIPEPDETHGGGGGDAAVDSGGP